MSKIPIWIAGGSRCGKTTALVAQFRQWVTTLIQARRYQNSPPLTSAVLVFAANDDNRRELADRLSTSIQDNYPIIAKTPLGFISDEVTLFFPLIFQQLNLKAQFPIRLRPETEQELATKLWRSHLQPEDLILFGGEYRFVRRILDLLQLAGAAGIRPESIPEMLKEGLSSTFAVDSNQNQLWEKIGQLLLQWRKWCLDRGLLSYGLIYELYWRYLLPNPTYHQHLTRRYQAIFADDVDDYPAVSRDLFSLLLDKGCFAVFTYNQDGLVRLGLNADPKYMEALASVCQRENLDSLPVNNVASQVGEQMVQLITDPLYIERMPESVRSLSTTSRAELLRTTAEVIIQAVKQEQVKPEEIAIIAPGLDEIGRYTLIDILTHQGIAIEPLNEQRPLISSPLIRALLTLLGLVYQGLGRLVETEAVAEMLVVLSQKPKEGQIIPDIDPVRAGLLADYCYHIDLELPRLLPVETFARWDRLGHRAVAAYQEIRQWIEEIKTQQKERGDYNPIIFLDRATKKFIGDGSYLGYERLATLRELMETAQHFWQVERRVQQNELMSKSPTATIAEFIQLLRRGTITANPYPLRIRQVKKAITLATIFQYRSLRSSHRWQFWLDTGSNLWSKGGSSQLLAAPLFLREWSGNAWMPEDQFQVDRERLERILRDLLARARERVYLCHSELGVNGTEQIGPLLTLVHLSQELEKEQIIF